MDYSLLIVVAAGMMKMATSDGFPLRQGAGTGSREVFGGYRGLQWRNSRSIVLLDVFRVYGHIVVKEVGQGSHEEPTRVGACPGGWAHPLPRGFLEASLTWTPSLPGCFPSKNKFREVSGQLDLV